MTLREILSINRVIKVIIDNSELNVEAVLKFKLLGFLKAFEPYVQNFETVRISKIREYGTENAETGEISIDPENEDIYQKFQDEMKAVQDTEIKLDINKLKPDEIFNKGLSSDYLMQLYDLVEE